MSPSPSRSRAFSALLAAGVGGVTWWVLAAGMGPEKPHALPVTQALHKNENNPASALPPGTGKGTGAAVPGSSRVPVTDAEFEEIKRRIQEYAQPVTGDQTREDVNVFTDELVARLGFTSRMAEILGPYTYTACSPFEGIGWYLMEALSRGLSSPGGAMLRAELVATYTHSEDLSPLGRAGLSEWIGNAGLNAPPAEYAVLREALAGDDKARLSLHRGHQLARMEESPVEVLTAARNDWLAAGPRQPSAPEGEIVEVHSTPPLVTYQSPAQVDAWNQIIQLTRRAPPGADYAALDTILLSFQEHDAAGVLTVFELEGARTSVLTPWVREQPEAAAAWVASHPGDPENAYLAKYIIASLGEQSPAALATWVRAFPPGPAKDGLVFEAMGAFIARDPATARALASGIGTADLREKALASLREIPPATTVPEGK